MLLQCSDAADWNGIALFQKSTAHGYFTFPTCLGICSSLDSWLCTCSTWLRGSAGPASTSRERARCWSLIKVSCRKLFDRRSRALFELSNIHSGRRPVADVRPPGLAGWHSSRDTCIEAGADRLRLEGFLHNCPFGCVAPAVDAMWYLHPHRAQWPRKSSTKAQKELLSLSRNQYGREGLCGLDAPAPRSRNVGRLGLSNHWTWRLRDVNRNPTPDSIAVLPDHL